jgi:hypothetical protein
MSAAAQAKADGGLARRPPQTSGAREPGGFREFHDRHRDAAGVKLKFTPAFNSYLEAIIADQTLSVETRAGAWLSRQAWGNFSDCAVNAKNMSLTQRDCADRLGVHESRVSHVFAEFKARGYLRTVGQALYPVDDPVTFAFSSNKCADIRKPSPQNRWNSYRKSWLQEHPTEAGEFSQARSVLARVTHRILADYKAAYGLDADSPDPKKQLEGSESVRTSANFSGGACEHPQDSLADSRKFDLRTPSHSDAGILIDVKKTKESKSSSSVVGELKLEATTTIQPTPIQTQTPPGAPPEMGPARFSVRLAEMFAAAGKPTPTAAQCDQIAAGLPADARQAYLDDLIGTGRIDRMKHPGALSGDVKAFMRGWPQRRAALIEQGRAESDGERRAANYTERLWIDFITLSKGILADPFASGDEIAEARKYPGLKDYRATPDEVSHQFDRRVERALATLDRGAAGKEYLDSCRALLALAREMKPKRVAELERASRRMNAAGAR